METAALLIRADGDQQIGTGHVMRCLALGQAWRMHIGGPVVFAVATEAPALVARLHAEGVHVVQLSAYPGSREDATQTAALARRWNVTWVIIDGYHFDAEYQRILKAADVQLLAIDDHGHAAHYYADVILNQNLHAPGQLYVNRQPYTRLLLGSRYLLLRHEFVQHGPPARTTTVLARRVLVTMGGSDPGNTTTRVIQALRHSHDGELAATVVIGGSNPYTPHIQALLHDSPNCIKLKHDVTDLSEEMRTADVAISAAGSTAWELAYMGLPSLLLVVAENQHPIAASLAQAGAAINLGWQSQCTPSAITRTLEELRASAETRDVMTRCGQALVDGNGTARVLMVMTGEKLCLRNVHEGDSRILWEWANDPDTRAVSFSSTVIPWQEHLNWFHTKVRSPHCRFFIATDTQEVPVGQVRYDLTSDAATISVSLDRRQRSKGYGNLLLRLSARALFAVTNIATIHAYVKPDNHASLRTFTKAGYTHSGMTETAGQPAVHFILRRSP